MERGRVMTLEYLEWLGLIAIVVAAIAAVAYTMGEEAGQIIRQISEGIPQ